MADMKVRDPIPEFDTLADIAEFWDMHSTADYEDLTYPVEFEVQLAQQSEESQHIKLLPELSKTILALAQARGVSVETLVNVWLTEKVLETN